MKTLQHPRIRYLAAIWTLVLVGLSGHPAAAQTGATPAEQISTPDGFEVELLYSVPNDTQGSWVTLTHDPQGRLVSSDQYGQLYRVTPPTDNRPLQVEPLLGQLGHAQGLLYAFDSLYVMVNAKQQSGLHRLSDTDGDDQFDKSEYLLPLDGEGEHGPHTILLTPDGQSLLICAGNHTKLPELTSSRVPRCWDEDQLLHRFWDPNGHATGRMAPGGWICRVSPDGQQRELVAIGFRNQYDCAYNADGQLFTYDADMEWDLGTAWYRPTRILHVTSGAEFGWRGGCYKWPAYAPDSLPAVIDLGPGSPTGLTFGSGAHFPASYQRALFACDWGRGVMSAIHVQPAGASFTAKAESFITAPALPLTDAIINPHDGAMYFTTGGRRIQSGLYRVTYRGAADENTAATRQQPPAELALREELERLHVEAEPAAALDTLWPQLAHADRHIRYAARVALEHQPVQLWLPRALEETRPLAQSAAAVAVIRKGQPQQLAKLWPQLTRLNFAQLDHTERLHLLRVYELALLRRAEFCLAAGQGLLLAQLDAAFPTDNAAENRELAKLLAHLQAPQIVPRALDHMQKLSSVTERTHYLLTLHNTSGDWTDDEFRRYLAACRTCKQGSGGKSYAGYVDSMVDRVQQLAGPPANRLEPELAAAQAAPQPASATINRSFVQKWQLNELARHLADGDLHPQHGDAAKGSELYHAVNCAKCHRLNGAGGLIGPDLTTIGQRFTPLDMLTTIVHPDREISSQYQSSIFELKSGKVIHGRAVDRSDKVVLIRTDMYNPGLLTRVRRQDIQTVRPAPTSPMPSGLLDTLTLTEIQDLLAYLYQPAD